MGSSVIVFITKIKYITFVVKRFLCLSDLGDGVLCDQKGFAFVYYDCLSTDQVLNVRKKHNMFGLIRNAHT